MSKKPPLPNARNRSRMMTEDEDLEIGLQRLLDKLRASQPSYDEEDVVEIPFPADCHTPPRSRSPVAEDSVPNSPTSSMPVEEEEVDLDKPLSLPLFITAVNLFEARMLTRNKKVALDAVKLVRQAYALVWQDSAYISKYARAVHQAPPLMLPSSPRGSAQLAMVEEPLPPLGLAANSKADALKVSRRSTSPSRARHRSLSPVPLHDPSAGQVLRLDACVQSLLVYANNSTALRGLVTSSLWTLRLLCFIGSAARVVEAAEAGAAPREERDVDRELDALTELWGSCGLSPKVTELLRECYLTEFLVDVALPPAVCSARYDGLFKSLYSKKQKLISELVGGRTGLGSLVRAVPLRGLAGLCAMSAYAEPRLRARLLDRLASGGLMERLKTELLAFVAELSAELSGASGSVPDSPAGRRGSRRASPARRSGVRRDSPEPDGHFRYFEHLLRSATPSKAARRSGAVAAAELTPLQRLSYCLDVLAVLTTVNLRTVSETEALQGNPRTAASAVVRASGWTEDKAALQTIAMCLLWFASVRAGRPGSVPLTAQQEQTSECLIQIAAHSAVQYDVVVRGMTALLTAAAAAAATSSSGAGAADGGGGTPRRESGAAATTTAEELPVGAAALVGGAGLLPVMLFLVAQAGHAEVYAASIRQWLRWLAAAVLPEAFEPSELTSGRRSEAEWGGRRRSAMRSAARSLEPANALLGEPAAPVMARDLQRAEVLALSPYFHFTCRLLQETEWRDGAEPFLARMAVLAYHVLYMQHARRRSNIVFGQASSCYREASALLRPVGGTAPGEWVPRSSLPSSHAPPGGSPSAGGRRSSGQAGKKRDNDGDGDDELTAFIPSPSRSPIFLEAYREGNEGHSSSSSSSEDEEEDEVPFIRSASRRRSAGGAKSPASPARLTNSPHRKRSTSSPPKSRAHSKRAPQPASASEDGAEDEGEEGEARPRRSWRDHLSLRMLFSAFSGGGYSFTGAKKDPESEKDGVSTRLNFDD